MSKRRSFLYIVDKLDPGRAGLIRKSLQMIPGIDAVKVTVNRGMIEVVARKDMAKQVQMACDVAGALYRTRVDA